MTRSPARRAPYLDRGHLVLTLKRRLEHQGFPRLQMSLLVAVSGGCGLLASWALLHAGLHSMAWRYPLTLGLAYAAFLALLGAWLRWQRSRLDDGAPDLGDLVDLADLVPGRGSGDGAVFPAGGGGDFAGGGATAGFDAPGTAEGASSLLQSSVDGLGDAAGDIAGGAARAAGDAAGAAADADELAVPLLAAALLLALLLAALYVVVIAPSLLAELLVDSGLSYLLLRRLRAGPPQHWLRTAIARTAWAFGLSALVLSGVGAALGAAAPGTHTLRQALHQAAR